MLALKNGLKSTWRAVGKALLFFVLLAVLTAVLTLGLRVYSAVSTYLSDCDDYFRTVVNLEYVGPMYGSDFYYDRDLQPILEQNPPEALAGLPGVLSWDPNRSALGVLRDVRRTDTSVMDQDTSVLVVSGLLWDPNTRAYQGWISEAVHAFEDVEGLTVFISPDGIAGLTEPGGLDRSVTRTYVFVGSFISGSSSYLWFMPHDIVIEDNGEELQIPSCEPVPDDTLPEDSIYRTAATAMARLRDSVRVQLTENLEDLLPFQQQELTLQEGRLFTAGEAGSPVCVISAWLSRLLGLTVGDTLPLDLYYNVGNGIYSLGGLASDPDDSVACEIVGIVNDTDAYRDRVFLPAGERYLTDSVPTGCVLGQFRVENDQAEAFCEEAGTLLDESMRLTVYNQGYQITAEPFREMLLIANIFLAVCALVTAAVLSLFAYLFVYRQRETARTMHALGSGSAHIYGYFAWGVCSVALPAAVCGALISGILEGRVMEFVEAFAAKYLTVDLRYSNAALTIVRTLDFRPDTPASLSVLSVLLMTAGSVLACACFTGSALRRRTVRKTVRRRTYRGRSSRMSGMLKYSLLSVRRGTLRTGSAVLVLLLIAVFLGQLTATSETNRQQLQAVQDNTVLRAYAANSKGLSMDNLVIPVRDTQQIFDSGLVSADVSSMAVTYRVEGVVCDAAGNTRSVPATQIPVSSFALETLAAQMAGEPLIVMTTSLANHPDFYYSGPPETVWLEGYDERCLAGTDPGICVVPETMLEGDLQLGSTVQFFTSELSSVCFLVVGAYTPTDDSRTVYMPLNYALPVGRTDGVTVPRGEPVEKDLRYDCGGTTAYVIWNNEAECQAFMDVYEAYRSGPLTVEIQFAEGIEKYMFFYEIGGAFAVVSEAYAAENGVKLMDTLECTAESGAVYPYTVVGTYRRINQNIHDIYCTPQPEKPEVHFQDLHEGHRAGLSTNSAVFTLNSTEELTAFRDTLEEANFRMVGSGSNRRTTVVIDDQEYTSTVRSLERQIAYTDALYRCLYGLTAVIGLVMSWLLVQSRKAEMAIMRGLGARGIRIFVTFFFEQLLLLVLGAGLGVLLWKLLGRPFEPLYPVMLLLFGGCWLAGSALCILRMLGIQTLHMLSERED